EDARATLTELGKRFAVYDTGVSSILSNMQRLTVAKQAARSVNNESEALLVDTTKLSDQFEGGGRTHTILVVLAIVFAVLALVCLVLLGKVFLDDARVSAFESEGENKRN